MSIYRFFNNFTKQKKSLQPLSKDSVPDKMNPDMIRSGLKTAFIGQSIVYSTKTESTNKDAKELAEKGAREGTLVITEEQAKGRGRLNRSWVSAPHENILISLIFRPALPPSKLFSLTMITSIAIVKAIRKTTGLKTKIKWPNDIYYNNKKLAGILTELNVGRNQINYAIVGIGLNVNADMNKFPEIKEIATSLFNETGKIISRNELLKEILFKLEKKYNLLKDGKNNRIRKNWNKYSLVTGRHVTVFSEGYSEEGIADSIAEDGSLILLKSNGEKKNILCGDVSLRIK
ncbi:MAG: biotin--[acetyl-CoA-carboxylase] ligase [Spirochaetes bacterium]|nr:biotin--[acetyl-CoA-carboxylase] ligase [Spirochaetota bacterium]